MPNNFRATARRFAHTALKPAYGMAVYFMKAILHGKGGDVFEMVGENFL
jgi:pyruvate dehydrogenase (quinone)